MSLPRRLTFAVAVNNRHVLERNLLASPCLQPGHPHEVLLQDNFASAALAYNDAIRKATNDLIIFIHQDIFLPRPWLSQVEHNLHQLERADPTWGVLGCWGATTDGRFLGHIYSTGLGVLGADFDGPTPVQTLDEIVLIVRKSTGLVFDGTLPHFHFYGTDICLRSERHGRGCYVIPAFCVHNTRQLLQLPKDFYECYFHVKRVWKDHLPIQTTCIKVSRCDVQVYRRRLQDLWRPFWGSHLPATDRTSDPADLFRQLIVTPANENVNENI
jgi:hypothetical protein